MKSAFLEAVSSIDELKNLLLNQHGILFININLVGT